MRTLLLFAFIFMAAPLHAEWRDLDITLVATGPSSLEGAMKYELKDAGGRTFNVNSPGEPDKSVMTRILKLKDEIFAWKHIEIKSLSFYMYRKGIQVVVLPSSATYRDTDLKPYLPSGFTFIERADGLDYRYRIIVENTSLKLGGAYAGEEPMLEELLAYVRGISEGTIVVEDEKVVSGSVVSITDEKKKGGKQVHPVGDLPDFDAKPTVAPGDADGNLRIYASAQASYLVPFKSMGDIFVGGYGSTVSIGLCDLGFEIRARRLFVFDIEFNAGYWYLNEREQRDEYADCSIQNAYIIPLGLTGRYRIGITRGFSIVPSAGVGCFYSRLEYERKLPNGTVKCVSAREWNPSVTAGARLEYRFQKVFVFTGAEFMMMFERRMNIATLIYSAGAGYMF